ncbi:MAG: hypothetical protein Q7T53_11100 [Deltaproteobacteria bacterium]|nr:hypothetical protein [Deltaproteobacteria bacterium]
MIIKRNIIVGLIFLSIFSAIPLRAEDIQAPKVESAAISATSSSESGMKMEEGGMKHEEMSKDKEHEGMHGMMMGHDMKGWWIVIGVVMVIMMGAHVAVLF